MADTTVGQAIALGNLARPDTTKVFTNAVMRGQEMNLRRRKIEQDEAAKKQQLQNQIANMIDPAKGGFLPLYQEQARDLIAKYGAEIKTALENNDVIKANQLSAQMNFERDNLKAQNDRFAAGYDKLKTKGFADPSLISALNKPMSQFQKEYADIISRNPHYRMLVDFDPATQNVNIGDYEGVDLRSQYDKTIATLMSKSFREEPTGRIIDGFVETKRVILPEAIQAGAMDLAGNRNVAQSVMFEQPKQYAKYYEEGKKQLLSTMPTPFVKVDENDPAIKEQLVNYAVSKVVKDELDARNQQYGMRSKPSSGRRDGTPIIPYTSQGEGYKIKISHPNKEGVEQEYTSTAKYSSQLELTKGAINSSLLKDAKTGNQYQTDDLITNIKTAVIAVLPIYKQGAMGKDSSGKQYSLSGRVVDDSNLTPEKANLYEWKPVVIGITDSDDQVLVEFDNQNNIMNTLKKGNIGRQAQTQYDKDQAVKVADEANRKKDAAKRAPKSAPQKKEKKRNASGIVDKNL